MKRENNSHSSGNNDEQGIHLMGRDWLQLSERRKQLWVERGARYWRSQGFPYIELSQAEAEQEIRALLRSDPKKTFAGNQLRVSMIGLKLANYFHPQMWHVPVHDYKTPFERFQDDWCLRDCIEKSFRFYPNRNSVNARSLRSTLRIYRGTTRVSNFRPTVARALCDRYSKAGDKILDFSAGYGGRLLGCVSLPRHYIGVEPCTAQVRGLRSMASFLERALPGTAAIIHGCAEEEIFNFRGNSIDFILSSPPYFNHERYADEPTQSYLRYPTYGEWRRSFLEVTLRGCHRVLRHRRILALNLGDPPGIPLIADVRKICRKLFKLKRILRMPLYRFPLQRRLNASAFKSEPIFILEKV